MDSTDVNPAVSNLSGDRSERATMRPRHAAEARSAMLFIAEGQIREPIESGDHTVAAAWLGPMVDSGLLHAGYLDPAGPRVVLILSAPDRLEIDQHLSDLPIVRDQKVRFIVTQVTALRFT